jgi:exopolysaccharide biosynthesis protein
MKSGFFLALVALTFVPLTTACAQAPVGRQYKSLKYLHETKSGERPQQIYVAAIDLTDPNVQVRVSRGGADPDGAGKWQTTLMRPTRIADREGFDVVINGDFFSHLSGKDAEGAAALKEFKSGIPAVVVGPAETDGQVWSATTQPSASIVVVDRSGRHVAVAHGGTTPPAQAWQAISGHDVLVRDGRNVAPPGKKPGFARGPHPRTAMGIANGGKTLLLVVVDGRKKGVATGMSLDELAEVMIEQGASDAVNFDGGGSSVLAIRDRRTGKMQIMNKPSDGAERSVANVLGVRLVPRKPGTTQPAR